MTIEKLGSKLYSGTKVDRVSPSLGSDADGTNNGITLFDNYVRCKVYNSSGVEQTEFTSAKLRSDIGTSAFENVTMTGSHTVAQGDRIVMETNGGDSSNKILFLRNNSNGNDNPSNTSYVRYESGSFSTQSKSITGSMIFNGSTVNLSSSTDEADSYPTSNEKFGLQIDASASQIGQTLTSVTFKLKRVGNNPAKLGTGAYEFDGSSSVVTTDQRVNGLHDGTGGSITFWVKKNSHADNDIIYATHNASGSGAGIEVKFNSSGNIKSTTTNSSSGWVDTTSTTALANDTWYHVAVTLDTDTKYRIYINGTLETTGSAFTPRTGNSSQAYTIGDNPSSGGYFDGVLDDMSIWSRALTATEIGKLANNNGEQNYLSESSTGQKQLDESANKYGIKLASDNPLIGKTLKSITFSMKKNNSPTGTVSAKIYKNDSTTATATSTNTLTVSTLSTSSFSDEPFEFASGVTLASGDRIVVEGGSHDGTNQIMFEQNSSSFTDTVTIARYTSSWVDGISGDFLYKLTSTDADAQLVSSLSDKSNLKAYYSMDSTTITSAPSSADWSEDFSTGSASHSSDGQTLNGWYANNHTRSYFDGSNNYGAISMHSSTNTALSFDLEQSGNGGLGTSINATNWTLRFRWHIISKASDHTNGTQGFIGLANTAGGSPSAIDGMGMSMVQAVSSGDKVINAISDNSNPMNYGGSGTSDRHIALEVSNGDDYWIQITRDGDTEILSIYSDSNYSTLVSSNSKTVSGVTGLRYFLAQAQNDSSAGYTTMYVDDIKFYDGVSIKDGCKNDFSSTSDLEALSGVRTNSIFQQTDVPEYWWYNGTSWLRDGSPPVGGNLHAWYDASDSTTVTKDSSNLVSQLNDKSGNGYNLTASGTGTGGQPLWVSGGKNDLDIIDFASSKMMAAQWSATAQPMTFVAFVYSPAADGSQDNFWDNYDDTNSSMGFVNGDSSDSNNLIAFAPTGLSAGSSSNYTQKWGLYTVSYNTTSSTISINGDQKASGNMGTNPSYGLRLPRHRTSATYGQIKLAELLIYNKVLSSDELTKINDYFVNKWGAVLE